MPRHSRRFGKRVESALRALRPHHRHRDQPPLDVQDLGRDQRSVGSKVPAQAGLGQVPNVKPQDRNRQLLHESEVDAERIEGEGGSGQIHQGEARHLIPFDRSPEGFGHDQHLLIVAAIAERLPLEEHGDRRGSREGDRLAPPNQVAGDPQALLDLAEGSATRGDEKVLWCRQGCLPAGGGV